MTLHQWVAASQRGTRVQREAFETGQLEAAEFLWRTRETSVVLDADLDQAAWDTAFDFWRRVIGVAP